MIFGMKIKLRFFLQACLILTSGFHLGGCASPGASPQMSGYKGTPFHDSVYHGGPQKIPGGVQCAYYDLGGEGVAYHDSDTTNSGSGTFNKPDGTYLSQTSCAIPRAGRGPLLESLRSSLDIPYRQFCRFLGLDYVAIVSY